MYLRKCSPSKGKKDRVYWELVESYRTQQGPRQRVISYLGDADEPARLGVKHAALDLGDAFQGDLFGESPEPDWVEVDTKRVRVERIRDFGGPWFGLAIWEKLGLRAFLEEVMPEGREEISWSLMAEVLVLMRLCEPSSELRIAEDLYARSALPDIVGIPPDKVNDDRLYRALDNLVTHKLQLERHLKERLGELFDIEYDLLLYDVTSTYFEGEVSGNELAARGYSRDHRPDCKQVCIALVVSRWGLPLGYEVFGGNRSDVTTVEEIVKKVEAQYGQANRIWVMDRGMVSEKNLRSLRSEGRKYIVGTAKSRLKRFERELLAEDWQKVRDGLDVKLCPGQEGEETFILCRSAARGQKEKAIHERFERNIEEGLKKLSESCRRKKQKVGAVERRVGRLLGTNSRTSGLYQVAVRTREDGGAEVMWEKGEKWRHWATLSEGCYVLRSNVRDWDAEQLWHAYIQLTEAEAAFRIHKDDLRIRPIWHQKSERVQGHILVCFLAYVLWKTIGQVCQRAGLGDEPRQIFDEIAQIKAVDVVLPTRKGTEIRRRCVSLPTAPQAALLERLGLKFPKHLKTTREM
ncbi:MAG: IS1634 family transposase [Chloroflexi bacterium]|nr:IS1634 family transposase [Chloroflexota bacterium]